MPVGGVFRNVASRYDVMNDVMSGGVHRLWKDRLMAVLAPDRDTQLLDLAGGTGDVAFRFLDSAASRYGAAASASVRVVDINPAMLAVGQERAERLGYAK
ncbi:hypothetical protein HK405_009215, partial [Cladochytrium tenue]